MPINVTFFKKEWQCIPCSILTEIPWLHNRSCPVNLKAKQTELYYLKPTTYMYLSHKISERFNLAIFLTLVLLDPDILCSCKQCRSRSVGFFRSWIYTVCHSVCEFVATNWIKQSDWLKIRSWWGILIYSTRQVNHKAPEEIYLPTER